MILINLIRPFTEGDLMKIQSQRNREVDKRCNNVGSLLIVISEGIRPERQPSKLLLRLQECILSVCNQALFFIKQKQEQKEVCYHRKQVAGCSLGASIAA